MKMANLLKLHEAIAVVLLAKPERIATIEEITLQIAQRNLYRQQNGIGDFPKKSQVRLRTHPNTKAGKTYSHLFEFIEPNFVRLRNVEFNRDSLKDSL